MGAKNGGIAQTAMGESLMLVSAEEGYRIWSAEYDRTPNPLLALESRILRERLEPLAGKAFLDVGTGTGRWMKYAATRGARVFGLDKSGPMLAVAADEKTLSGRLAVADMRRLPFAGGCADIAVCSFALSYVEPADEVMQELARAARCVIVSDLHPATIEAGWTRSFRSDDHVYEIAHFSHALKDLEDAAQAAGLARQWCVEACFGEPEREIFQAAGKPELYGRALGLPAVRIVCWSAHAR